MIVLSLLVLFGLWQQQEAVPAAAMRHLSISVECDKAEYAPGDTVTVNVYLTNKGKRAAVIMKPIHDGGIAASAGAAVTRGGETLTLDKESSVFRGQVGVHPNVTEDRFLTIKPGEKVRLYWEKFHQRWDLKGRSPGLKSSYTNAEKVPLEPGEYKVAATYRFMKYGNWGWDPAELRFQGDSKRLFDAALEGILKAETTFRIAAATNSPTPR